MIIYPIVQPCASFLIAYPHPNNNPSILIYIKTENKKAYPYTKVVRIASDCYL